MLRNDRVRAERERRGWTQRELARRAGLHYTTLSHLESNEGRVPDPPSLVRLAAALEVDPRFLLPLPSDPTLGELRHVAGLHATELAAAFEVSSSTIRAVEAGEWRPQDVERWADLLGVDVADVDAAWRRANEARH